jgi:copper chaperone CopZ
MRTIAMAVASLAMLVWLGSAQAEVVKLEIKGAYCANCAKALKKSIGDVPGAKLEGALKATKEDPQIISVDLDTAKSDIGDLGKSIIGAETPHKSKVAPTAAVVVPVNGLTKDDSAKVQKALEGVKGVLAKEARADNGQAIVVLDEKGGAKMSEIKKALTK